MAWLGSLKIDAVRDRMFSHLGLHALVEDIKRQGDLAARGEMTREEKRRRWV